MRKRSRITFAVHNALQVLEILGVITPTQRRVLEEVERNLRRGAVEQRLLRRDGRLKPSINILSQAAVAHLALPDQAIRVAEPAPHPTSGPRRLGWKTPPHPALPMRAHSHLQGLISISHAGMIEARGSGKPPVSNVEDDHGSSILLSVISIQASLVTFLGVGISILSNGVTQFISMFSVFLGFGKEFGALLLTANFIGAMIGVPILVRLSDKIRRRLVSILLAVSASILTVLLCFPNRYLMIVIMIGLGAFATSIHTILILILHELMPERKGLATSLIYGIAFGIGGLTAPLTGHLIDVGGFISTFQILALIGIISATPLIFMRLRPPR